MQSLDHKQRRADRRAATEPGGESSTAGLDEIGDGLAAQVGATLGSPAGDLVTGGSLQSGSAWSTIKVPIALRVLEEAGGPASVSPTQRAEIERALTASDNEAAAALFDDLAAEHGGIVGAAAAVTETLREAGDTTTQVSTEGRDGFSPYGQTDWSLAEQARFVSALAGGCIGSPQSRRYLLGLMGRVSSDLWGLGSVSAPARWKGGWGPGTDGRYLLRQMGVIEVDGRRVAATFAVIPDDGSFESGQAIASELARRLIDEAGAGAGEPLSCAR